jgi:hypothetical protein
MAQALTVRSGGGTTQSSRVTAGRRRGPMRVGAR